MIGAFYQPKAVAISLEALSTLPPNEFLAGMAEVVKYGVIRDPESQLGPEDVEDGSAGTGASRYNLGCKVHHPEYGVGTVIGVEGSGEKMKLTVSFSIYGSKKFVPRYARLEKI